MQRIIWLLAGCAALAGCSDEQTIAEIEQNTIVADIPTTVRDVVEPAPPVPTHNWNSREGETYFYVAEVSEEDRKKGQAAGDVVGYRYLGHSGGLYRLERVSDSGEHLSISECTVPCKVYKTTSRNGEVTRRGFTPDSIAGAALTDAFNGFLKPIKLTPIKAEPKAAESDQDYESIADEVIVANDATPD